VIAGTGMWSRRFCYAEGFDWAPLSEFGYGDVFLSSDQHESQLMNTHAVLMELSDDSLRNL
jgi:uncharacterized protein